MDGLNPTLSSAFGSRNAETLGPQTLSKKDLQKIFNGLSVGIPKAGPT